MAEQPSLIVVDANDKETGVYLPFEQVQKQNLYHRAIHVLIQNSQRQILLQQRESNDDPEHPTFWTSPIFGRVFQGQTYLESALHKMRYNFSDQASLKLEEIGYLKEPDLNYNAFVKVYMRQTEGPFTINSPKIKQLKWFTLGEVEDLVDYNEDECSPGFIYIWQKFCNLF
jgi:isopentenyldiphosphate isomerase